MTKRKTGRIEKEDIISDEAIKNIARANNELRKLDAELELFAKRYNIDLKNVWDEIQKKI